MYDWKRPLTDELPELPPELLALFCSSEGTPKQTTKKRPAPDGVEEVALTAPWNALKAAGAEVKLISDEPGEIQAVNHGQKGNKFPVDAVVSQVSAWDFDALVLPGGVANPDKLHAMADGVKRI